MSEGNIYRANLEQLQKYQSILNTMHVEKRSEFSWIDDKIMSNSVDSKLKASIQKYGGLRQSSYPVVLVFEGMGLKKLARKMGEHAGIEQGHIGTWAAFEVEAKKAIGNNFINRRWNKWKEMMYLFDRNRYMERKKEGLLTAKEKRFIDKATTKEWRDGTNKKRSQMFTDNPEGKLGKKYIELTDYYPAMLNEVLSKHLNTAQIEKWKEDNNVLWVQDKVYIHRGLTDKFKKLYDPRGQHYIELQKQQADIIADKLAKKKLGKNYTKEDFNKVYDDASNIAYAELSDLFMFSSQKFSSKFLEKRNIKLPEFVKINGKKVQVYETSYEKTVLPYALTWQNYFLI